MSQSKIYTVHTVEFVILQEINTNKSNVPVVDFGNGGDDPQVQNVIVQAFRKKLCSLHPYIMSLHKAGNKTMHQNFSIVPLYSMCATESTIES